MANEGSEVLKSEADVPPMFDVDGALSRSFLLARGTCCGFDCKNCPYDLPKACDLFISAKDHQCES